MIYSAPKKQTDPTHSTAAKKRLLKPCGALNKCKGCSCLRRNVTLIPGKCSFFVVRFKLITLNVIAPPHTKDLALGFKPIDYLHVAVYSFQSVNGGAV